MRAVADIAHEAGVPLVIDNTVATPYLQRPKDFGADIVVHSATKFLGGHGTSLGGVVVDLGTFDFAADPSAGRSSPPYRRVPGGSLVGPLRRDGSPYIALVKTKYVHDLGPSLSAFNAFQLLQGLETLDLRMPRHSASALPVARFLDAHPAVARVHHPGLASSPWHERGARYLPRGASSVFSFDLHAHRATPRATSPAWRSSSRASGRAPGREHRRRAQPRRHPASMTHSHLSPDAARRGGHHLDHRSGCRSGSRILADIIATSLPPSPTRVPCARIA